MYSICSFIWIILLVRAKFILCHRFGHIIGLNKFEVGQGDKLLFFDTPSNGLYHTKLWNKGYKIDNYTWTLLSSEFLLQRTATGLGLHHEVFTKLKVELEENNQFTDKCFAMFAEHVTQSFFIDIYEIQRRFLHQLYYNSSIDIERTAYEASNHTLLVVKELKFNGKFYETEYKLPWHIRYHKPAMDKYVKLTLPTPEIYLTCIEQTNEYTLESSQNFEWKNLIQAPCPTFETMYHSQDKKKLCTWVEASQISENELVFQWPVGLISELRLITVCTLFVIIFGTVYLMYVLLRAPDVRSDSKTC